MTNLSATVVMLGLGKESLRLLIKLTEDAAAEYAPPGYDFDRQRRGDHGVERPVLIRLSKEEVDKDGELTGAGGELVRADLDDPLRRSVVKLRGALADLAEVPDLADVIAPTWHGNATLIAEHADLCTRLHYGLLRLEGPNGLLRREDDWVAPGDRRSINGAETAAQAAQDACDAILEAVAQWPAWLTRTQRRCAGRPEWWQPSEGEWELRPRDCQRRLTGRGHRCDACKRWLTRLREMLAATTGEREAS